MSNILFSLFPNETFIDLKLYQFGWEKCAPSHAYGPAARNHFLFHYILSGRGTLMSDNSGGQTVSYPLKAGDGFMIFPHQINTYVASHTEPWEYVWLEFDGLKAQEIVSLSGFTLDTPLYRPSRREFTKLMAEEMLYIANNAKMPPFHLIGHLYLFADLLIRSCRLISAASTGRLKDFYIQEALSFIEQNFQRDISVEDIAAFCNLNRSYFGKLFKSVLGRSPQEFLMTYRMSKAAQLLKLTRLSVGDIAQAVGYANQLHFSRAFKNIYGVPPREWRRKNGIKE